MSKELMVNKGRPFMGLICGHTNSGKTFFLLQLLEKEFRGFFEHVYLLCPTTYRNKTYVNWKCFPDLKFYPIDCSSDKMEEFLAVARDESIDSNTLLILDDLACSKEIKRQSSELTELAFGGRHEGLSVIVLTQQYTSVAKAIREQLEWVVTFMLCDEEDLDVFLKKYLRRLSEEKKKEVLEILEKKKYAYILVQLRHQKIHRLARTRTKGNIKKSLFPTKEKLEKGLPRHPQHLGEAEVRPLVLASYRSSQPNTSLLHSSPSPCSSRNRTSDTPFY